MAECCYTIQCAAPSPNKIAPSHAGCEPHLLHSSTGTPKSSTQTASQSVQPFLHRSRQSIPIFYNVPSFTLKIAPPMGIWTPKLYTILASIRAHNINSPYFTMNRPISPQNYPFSWGIWTPSNTWFLEPTRVLNKNGIFIG